MKPTAIYVLMDIDGLVRYVGKSITPRARFRRHKRLHSWVVTCVIIEWVSPKDDWQHRERFWIQYYRRWYALENQSDGGDVWAEATPAIRQKISIALKGRTFSEETKEKLRQAATGRKRSLEASAKIIASLTGRSPSEESRAKMRAWQLGLKRKPAPPEVKAKQSAALKGKQKTLEHRLKIGAAHVGMKRTPEACAQMSVAQRASRMRRGQALHETQPYEYGRARKHYKSSETYEKARKRA